ncbi:hypothetical protein XI04_32780 [Bradyrhizobium sp. CCBAU 11430]|nr:hypothetical protein [Bradyrhizobium sp. CCBAU 21359]MDA9450765.1 hypothetical protein [Bradyrhizobium sp. CCBAU 21360]MDA9458516.1 hypothetical protein [Bradyrhizobium sp. CCBAU 21359]MDA9517784.1 hypothetical protein [Bradyrhizobium sp. CCBAU 11430]
MLDLPPLYEEHQVLKCLKLRASELEELLNIGIIAPVARRGRDPLYCVEAIDALATDFHHKRLGCAIWWDFDSKRPGFLPDHAEWSPPDVPFYPFDEEDQQFWTRRYFKLKRAYAPFPFQRPDDLARRRAKLEAVATKAFARKHGIKRPRKTRRVGFPVRHRWVTIGRAKLRDLVWSKTLIRAAKDLGVSEFALRSQCKRWLIPLPTRGHFNHKDPRKRPPPPELPPLKGMPSAPRPAG